MRALTLHMLEHLAPRLFASRGLRAIQAEALERCATVAYVFDRGEDSLEASIDAWYCRYLKGLPHPPPEEAALRAALRSLVEEDNLIYAWVLGEQASRCGVDVRAPMKARPYLGRSRLHDAYWLTHLVLLDSDYFARPLSHPEAATWADALEDLVPWLREQPHADLAGEVASCLRFLGRDARAALALLSPLSPTLSPAGERERSHELATALLAHSAE